MGKLIRITSAFALSTLVVTGAPALVAASAAAATTDASVHRVVAPPSPHCTPVSALPRDERASAQAPEPRPLADEPANPTYQALDTPRRMIPGDRYPIRVTVTNTTPQPLVAGRHVLSYHWTLPNGQDATAGTRIDTDLPALAPGATVAVDAEVEAPTLADIGNEREQFVLRWDIYDKNTRRWLSETAGVSTLDLPVRVEQPTSDQLGLEQFYAYAGVPTGAGGNLAVNQFSGNGVWNYDVLTNPSRGLASFLRLSHNTKDTSDSYAGPGWSVSTSTLNRLGTPLEFGGLLPGVLGWPTTVTLVDGDGTSHVWELNKHDSTDSRRWTYDAPAGVHLHLRYLPDGDDDRRWVFTSPERTNFYFDDQGYHTSTVEKNGNTLSFTYERALLGNRNTGILRYVTDATGRRTLTFDYYQGGDAFSVILGGHKLTGTNLDNLFIIDKLKSVTDVSGRTVAFTYTDRGSLGEVIDGLGDEGAKPFTFFYDEDAGKLTSTVDPNGNATRVAYFTDTPRKWHVRTVTDRLDAPTGLDYADPDGDDGSKITNTLVDGNGHTTTTTLDGFGRPERITNAKGEKIQLHWDEDNNVIRLVENNGAMQTWRYDQKTGFPLEIRDAEANENDGPATRLGYRTALDGHVADLVEKVTPEGRKWTFVYDDNGNLLAVTDPKGNATPDQNDHTSRYSYDAFGQLIEQIDANGNTTTYGDYDPNGFPRLITDALDCTTFFRYDDVGNVVTLTDARNKTSTYTYDVFKRPLDTREPKDQAAGVYIVTPGPRYDRNDNVVTSTAANGAVTRVAYDEMDQTVGIYAPPDQQGGPDKLTTFAYDRVGNLLFQTEPKGNATAAAGDFTYSFVYDEVDQLVRATDAAGNRITAEYDDVGNLVKEIDARKNATQNPDDFTTRYVFDANHQVVETVDAAGNSAKTRYDRDGNVVASTDEEGNETFITLDERGLQTEVRSPHSRGGDGTIRYFTTRYEYDQMGNLTRTINPRGVDTDEPNDFVAETVYDELNRQREEILPYDPGDAEHRTAVSTIYTYDEVGNLTVIDAPPSHGESARNVTRQTWYDNGWLRTSTDSWDIRTAYDYTPTGQQSNRTVTSAGGGAERVETWEYYPDGKVRKHSDGGIPVGRDVVVVDNASQTRAGATGDWRTGESAKGFQGEKFRATDDDAASFRWQASVPADGNYEVLVRYPMGRATDAAYTVEHDGGTSTVTVDQTKRHGEWVSLGMFPMSEGGLRTVTLSGKANGTVAADAVQLVRDNRADADDEQKVFDYRYDLNDNLVELTDSTPDTPMDTLRVAYNGVNLAEKVEELKDGSVNHTTEYRYNENDALTSVRFDGKTSLYEYGDPRDLVTKVTNKKDDSDAGKVNSFTYTERGHVERHTKSNGNTVDYTYYLDGLQKRQVEHKKNDGPLVAEHNLTYDPNSNRTRDDGRKQNADNHAETIDTDATYTYDPRDRVRKVTKDGADGQRTEEYKNDDNGNVWDQTIDGVHTAFDYRLNRLVSSTTDGETANYDYDAFGRLYRVTQSGQQLEKYTYDGFDRKTEHVKGEGASAKTTTYTYDPLDRQQTQKVGDKTTSFHYLGLSDQVLTEDENGKLRKSYHYSNEGELLAQVKFNDDGTEEDSVYGYNPHSDVEQVTDDQGDTKSTYGYTAYGKDDEQEFSGEDKPDQANPDKPEENSYRFNTTRHDQSTDTYDMGFRDYSPGLNRFLTLDLYNGALSDLTLATDPWTNNRYAFGAGNPLSQVEIDGHGWFDDAVDWVEDNASDLGHAALDVVGVIPVVGEAADLANAAWYTAEGDYANAALSAAAAIPFAGWGATAVKAGKYAVKGAEAAQGAAKAADAGTSAARTASKAADAGTNGAKTAPTPKTAPKAGSASGGRPSGGGGGKAGGTASTGKQASGGGSGGGKAANGGGTSATSGGAGAARGGSRSGTCNSFAPDATVVMADGTSKPIEDVRVGDQVLATDPETGLTVNRPVTALITGEGQKNLVELTVDTDGVAGDATGTVTATDQHPFWVDDQGRWVEAEDLRPGDRVRTDDGRELAVVSTRAWTEQWQRVHNLTVAGVHTYYINAGTAPVLVHNCPLDNAAPDDLYRMATQGGSPSKLSPAGRAVQKHADPTRSAAQRAKYDYGATTNMDRNWVGETLLQEILTDPTATRVVNHSPRAAAQYGGSVLDIKMGNGIGARWSMRGGRPTFEGFL